MVHVPRIAHGVEMKGFCDFCLLGHSTMSKQSNSAWSCEKMSLGTGIPLPKSHLPILHALSLFKDSDLLAVTFMP